MITKNVIGLLLKKGFAYIGCNQPDVAIFYKSESSAVLDVCILTDYTGGHIYSSAQLSSIENEIERKFILNGYRDISCHFIIFTDNIDRERSFSASGLSFWLVDTLCKRVIVYDNQRIDFHEVKAELERIIATPDISKAAHKKRFIPYITICLIAINVLVFTIMEFFGNTYDSLFMAQHGAMSWRFLFENHEYYRLISSIFLHFGPEHLLNNMVTLGVIGYEFEQIIGHTKFAVIYMLSGIGAGLVSAVYNMNVNHSQYIISAGASGAIFGLIGALLVTSLLYRHVRKRISPANLAIIAVLSIFNGFMSFEIDNMAHIGGLMFGIIITFISCVCSKSVIK